MPYFLNTKTEKVIFWADGSRLTSVWKEVDEIKDQKKTEEKKDEIVKDGQLFKSLKEVESDADKTMIANTKAGNSYSFDEEKEKWVKTDG